MPSRRATRKTAKSRWSTTERRLAPDSPDWVFGAFVANELAGVVGLAREPRAKNRHKGAMFGMYVAPEHGRRGVGAALLRRVIEAARSQPGLEQLVLTVTETNVAARTLYEKFGFRSFGIEPRAIRVSDVVLRQEPHDPLPDAAMTIPRFSFPTTIHFGPGARALVADHLKAEDIKRPLVVTDRGIAPLPLLADFVASLSGPRRRASFPESGAIRCAAR